MPTVLTQQTLSRCRAVFAECAEFSSDAQLRSVFVTEELAPFKLGVPSASALGERIALLLDYLLVKKLKSGQPALPFFIAALRDRYLPGDALYDDLEDLYQQVSAASPPTASPAPQRAAATATIRALLNDAFSDGELTTLCFDYFPAVYDQFGSGMSRSDKIQRLIEYCARNGQMALLVDKIKEMNPAQYQRYADRL